MVRTPDTGGLWVFPEELAEAKQARALAAANHGLFLVNGTLPTIWPEVKTPPVWFLSPGILLDSEFETVRKQIAEAGAIVLYVKYDQKQEAWKWPEFAAQRALFEEKPAWEGKYFSVYMRRK
jgi:hypothetical protein